MFNMLKTWRVEEIAKITLEQFFHAFYIYGITTVPTLCGKYSVTI
jgi:hypothetical protein